jgi:hypothetical protein
MSAPRGSGAGRRLACAQAGDDRRQQHGSQRGWRRAAHGPGAEQAPACAAETSGGRDDAVFPPLAAAPDAGQTAALDACLAPPSDACALWQDLGAQAGPPSCAAPGARPADASAPRPPDRRGGERGAARGVAPVEPNALWAHVEALLCPAKAAAGVAGGATAAPASEKSAAGSLRTDKQRLDDKNRKGRERSLRTRIRNVEKFRTLEESSRLLERDNARMKRRLEHLLLHSSAHIAPAALAASLQGVAGRAAGDASAGVKECLQFFERLTSDTRMQGPAHADPLFDGHSRGGATHVPQAVYAAPGGDGYAPATPALEGPSGLPSDIAWF